MQAAFVTSFHSAVDPYDTSHVEGLLTFPFLCQNYCCMIDQELLVTLVVPYCNLLNIMLKKKCVLIFQVRIQKVLKRS